MKIIKKNELTILVIALMLVTAGYLDYIGRNKTQDVSSEFVDESIATEYEVGEPEDEIAKIGDAKLVSDNQQEIQEVFSEENKEEAKNEEVEVKDDEYFISAKLDRATMYSQVIENYQTMIENPNVSAEQKSVATQEIAKINQTQNSIMICENLLLAKGFDKCVIFVNDKSISVIVGKENLSQEEIAQIQNIISRELEATADNIHISVK